MKNRIRISINRLSAKLTLVIALAVCSVATAFADNELTIENIILKPGETKVVPVILNNSDPISSLQMDITLPEGVYISSDGVLRNEDRLFREEHTVSINYINNFKQQRITILTINGNPIQGNSGELIYLTLESTSSFVKSGKLEVTNIIGSDVNATKVEINSITCNVDPYVGFARLEGDSISATPNGAMQRVDVTLNNDVTVAGFSAEFTLPEGADFEKNSLGSPKFIYSSRLPQNATISSNKLENGKVRVIVSSTDAAEFKGNDGVLFSFNVTASDNLAKESKIYMEDAMVSHISGDNTYAYSLDSYDSVKVINSYLAYYEPAKALIDSLQNTLDAAIAAVDTLGPDVKDSVVFVNTLKNITDTIAKMSDELEKGYADETLTYLSQETKDKFEATLDSIEKYVADITAAQKAFDANEAKKAANEEAYVRLSATIANMQVALDQANDSIANNYADVAEMFKSDADSIQSVITEAKEFVDSAYAVVGLNEESEVDSASVLASIETMIAEAKAAQEAFDADEAKKAANEEAYTRLSAEIAKAQKALDEANDTIAEKCPDVASDFTNKIDSIQAIITELNDSIETAYEAVELNEESEIDTESILAGIEALIAEAKEAQKEYEISSGIFGIEMSGDNKIVGIYTISGTKVHTPTKGQINIFKFADGSVKKCFVK
mgnify:CR=1 FL=1